MGNAIINGETDGSFEKDKGQNEFVKNKNGFYEKLRQSIKKKLYKVEQKFGKKGVEIILLAPDLFILLERLVRDSRVDPKKKIVLGVVISYWVLPADILPEMVVGPIGYLDDILLTLYALDQLFADTDIDILLEHWPGDPDVIKNIHKYAQQVKVLLSAIGGNIEEKINRLLNAILMKSGRKSS